MSEKLEPTGPKEQKKEPPPQTKASESTTRKLGETAIKGAQQK